MIWGGVVVALVLAHGADTGAVITGGIVWALGAPFIR